jgi:hypothetical protein
MRYSIKKSPIRPTTYLVVDNVKNEIVFRGTWGECNDWVDQMIACAERGE